MPPWNIENKLEALGAVVKGILIPSSFIRSTINYDAYYNTRGIIVLDIYVCFTSYSY